MKRILVACAALALLVGCREGQKQAGQMEEEGSQAMGQQGQQPGQERMGQADERPGQMGGQAQAGAEQTATGTLTEVEDERITMRTATGEQMEFQLDEDVQITMNGQPIQRERLQQGASVRASYTEQDGQMMVQKLEVQSMGEQPGMQPGGSRPGEQPGQGQPMPQQ